MPALLSTESRPRVSSANSDIHLAAFKHEDYITIVTVNPVNRPQAMKIKLEDLSYTGKAVVLFEQNREVDFVDGIMSDLIDGMGRKVYRFRTTSDTSKTMVAQNLILNPSFEEQSSIGIPDGYEFIIPLGSSILADPRTFEEGHHSVRITCNIDNQNVTVISYPVQLNQTNYQVSIYAKSLQDNAILSLLGSDFQLTTTWQKYSMNWIPPQSPASKYSIPVTSYLQSVIWVDNLEVTA